MTRTLIALGIVALSFGAAACSDDPVTGSTEGAGGTGGAGATTTATSTSASTSTATTASGSSGDGGSGAGGAGGASSSSASSTSSTSSTSASATTSTSSGPSPDCAAPSPDACGTCVFDKCNARYCECLAEPDCAALGSCLGGCAADDDACLFGCFGQHPTAVSEAGLLGDCVADACGTQGGACADAASLDACAECTLTSCEAELEGCNADAACNALIACAAQCADGDDTCTTACALKNTSGIGKAQTLQGCLQGKCATPCAGQTP